MTGTRTLVVGSGLIGAALAGRLVAEGAAATLCSRRPPVGEPATGAGPGWRELDVTDRAACVRTVDVVRPDAVVLVHGPSDVTWCESCPVQARHAHAVATTNMLAAAAGARFVLVSTDNVFPGTETGYDEGAPTAPANSYGHAKLGAERVMLDSGQRGTVLRVSLVYGWQPRAASGWLNHFEQTVRLLRQGAAVEAPDDHWNTPVLVDDVSAVLAGLLSGDDAPPVVHLGGPDRISRYDWAVQIADALGRPRRLVRPVPRAVGRYACRPANACLSSRYLPQMPATAGIPVRGIAEGLRLLLAAEGGGGSDARKG